MEIDGETVTEETKQKNFNRLISNQCVKYVLEELVDVGIVRYQSNYSNRYQDTNRVLYQKYTYGDARWLTTETLDSVDWLPADLGLIQKIKKYILEQR